MSARITLLVPTRFDNRHLMELCLETIRKYTTIPHRVIVGDAGADEETLSFLASRPDVSVVPCPDPLRPKDTLVREVTTPYFMILHDDTQILRTGWLSRRLRAMDDDPEIGVLGALNCNYTPAPWWRRLSTASCLHTRFYPVALTVRKAAQDELGFYWGKLGAGSFDTGAIAYLQLLRQKKWKFRWYHIHADVKHWNCKTWAIRKQQLQQGSRAYLQRQLIARQQKVAAIKEILANGTF